MLFRRQNDETRIDPVRIEILRIVENFGNLRREAHRINEE